MNILVTGGAGYIGSHTVRALQQAGYTPIIVDNLSRGHVESIPEGVKFYNMDIADPKLVGIMKEHNILGVMHFAAHSQVGESMQNPAIYYENNVVGSYHLIESGRTAGIKHFVFSQNLLLKYGQAAWTDKMPQQYQVLHILRGKAKNQKAFQWHDQSCVQN